MNRTISYLSTRTYRHIAKPLLFKAHPDTVHHHMIKSASFVQRLSPVERLVRHSYAFHDQDRLSQTIHSLAFSNPVGLSAGLDKNFELLPIMKAVGFGFMEGGSVTFKPCKGNPRPWFYRLKNHHSIVVHAGLANRGVKEVIGTLQSYSSAVRQQFPLNVSVAKTNSPTTCTDTEAIADYIGSLRELESAKVADMYTLNISCPNTFGGEPFTTPAKLEKLLCAVDQLAITRPVFIKMPIDLPWSEFRALVQIAARHHVDGLTIGNLTKQRHLVGSDLPDEIKGGLSGKPTQRLCDELIRHTYNDFRGRFIIIGVGGIFTAEDAYKKIRSGANLVELVTGLIFEGPQLIGRINHDLTRLLARDGFANISEAVGVDVRD